MTIMLRYRDLSVPLGATISRHRDVIEREGLVMWGWIMRQREKVPEELLISLAIELESKPSKKILLYDSGTCQLRIAQLSGLSLFPGGIRIPTPEPKSTPLYMSEALCPVWFHLTSIETEPLELQSIEIIDYPTFIDSQKSTSGTPHGDIAAPKIQETHATLWKIQMNIFKD